MSGSDSEKGFSLERVLVRIGKLCGTGDRRPLLRYLTPHGCQVVTVDPAAKKSSPVRGGGAAPPRVHGHGPRDSSRPGRTSDASGGSKRSPARPELWAIPSDVPIGRIVARGWSAERLGSWSFPVATSRDADCSSCVYGFFFAAASPAKALPREELDRLSAAVSAVLGGGSAQHTPANHASAKHTSAGNACESRGGSPVANSSSFRALFRARPPPGVVQAAKVWIADCVAGILAGRSAPGALVRTACAHIAGNLTGTITAAGPFPPPGAAFVAGACADAAQAGPLCDPRDAVRAVVAAATVAAAVRAQKGAGDAGSPDARSYAEALPPPPHVREGVPAAPPMLSLCALWAEAIVVGVEAAAALSDRPGVTAAASCAAGGALAASRVFELPEAAAHDAVRIACLRGARAGPEAAGGGHPLLSGSGPAARDALEAVHLACLGSGADDPQSESGGGPETFDPAPSRDPWGLDDDDDARARSDPLPRPARAAEVAGGVVPQDGGVWSDPSVWRCAALRPGRDPCVPEAQASVSAVRRLMDRCGVGASDVLRVQVHAHCGSVARAGPNAVRRAVAAVVSGGGMGADHRFFDRYVGAPPRGSSGNRGGASESIARARKVLPRIAVVPDSGCGVGSAWAEITVAHGGAKHRSPPVRGETVDAGSEFEGKFVSLATFARGVDALRASEFHDLLCDSEADHGDIVSSDTTHGDPPHISPLFQSLIHHIFAEFDWT